MGKNWFTVLFIYLLIISSLPGALPLFRFLTANKISPSEISWSKISIISWLSILSKSSSRFISSVYSSSFSFSYLKYSYNWSIVILIFLFVPFLPNLSRIFESCFDVFCSQGWIKDCVLRGPFKVPRGWGSRKLLGFEYLGKFSVNNFESFCECDEVY